MGVSAATVESRRPEAMRDEWDRVPLESLDSRRRDGRALTRRHLVGVSGLIIAEMARRRASGSGGAEPGLSIKNRRGWTIAGRCWKKVRVVLMSW